MNKQKYELKSCYRILRLCELIINYAAMMNYRLNIIINKNGGYYSVIIRKWKINKINYNEIIKFKLFS